MENLYHEDNNAADAPPLVLSVADPANLQGILTPERRTPMHPKNRVLFQGGLPLLAWEGQAPRELAPIPVTHKASLLAALKGHSVMQRTSGFSLKAFESSGILKETKG